MCVCKLMLKEKREKVNAMHRGKFCFLINDHESFSILENEEDEANITLPPYVFNISSETHCTVPISLLSCPLFYHG